MITEITINNKTFYCSDISEGFMNSDLEKVEEFEEEGITTHLWDSLYHRYGWNGKLHIMDTEELMKFLDHVDELKGSNE